VGVSPGPQAGGGYVLWSPFGSGPYPQDDPHALRVLRSPEFVLGSGEVKSHLTGGAGAAESPTAAGFMGVALRDAATGSYLASGRKASAGNGYEAIVFTAAQLAAHVGKRCTLDLIDSASGKAVQP
jgi:hypothetical protein